MAEKDLYIKNQEIGGELVLSANNASMLFSSDTKRIFTGSNASSSQEYGRFNIITNDNGLSVKVRTQSKFGLRLDVKYDGNNLIEGYGSDNTKANFQVTGAGVVYARKYITTLAPFPDYVFQPDYELRTFTVLRDFINTNKHLPNMPTASYVEKNGADIGEINRLLVEKVEELTLYILELEERVVEVELTDEEEPALQERITRIEKMISNLSEEQK